MHPAPWVFMPEELIGTDEGYRVLRHELVHVRDAWRTGLLPFAFSYLFLLPAGLTLRAFWELRAYTETMRVEFEETGTIADSTLEHAGDDRTAVHRAGLPLDAAVPAGGATTAGDAASGDHLRRPPPNLEALGWHSDERQGNMGSCRFLMRARLKEDPRNEKDSWSTRDSWRESDGSRGR